MRSTYLSIFLIITCVLAIASAFKVLKEDDNAIEQKLYVEDLQFVNPEFRLKRQLENLDEDYPTPTSQGQEEPGFWDRIIRVALKLFNRFVEWLNTS